MEENYQKVVLSNLNDPGFREKITTLGEDYLMMKSAMLSTKTSAKNLIDGFISAKVTTDEGQQVELKYDHMSSKQKTEALARYKQQQSELQDWINSSPVLLKQMEGCTAKSKGMLMVSCVGFMSEDESTVENYRQWNLGNSPMKKLLANINKEKK